MTGTDRIGQDLGVILVAATVNQALKHFGRGGEVSTVKINLKNFVSDLNKLATVYKARFTANNYTTYFDKELLNVVVKNCSPLGKFVSVTSEEVIITATNFETELKTAVATATLNYATLLVKYINDIDKIRSHVVEEKSEAGLDTSEDTVVKEVEVDSDADNDKEENEVEGEDDNNNNTKEEEEEYDHEEKENVEMEEFKEDVSVDGNLKEAEEERGTAKADKTTEDSKQDVSVEKEGSSSDSESEEEEEVGDEEKAETDDSQEEAVEVEKIEAPQLKSLDDNEGNDINVEEDDDEKEEEDVSMPDDEDEEDEDEEKEKRMEVENKEEESDEEIPVVENDLEEKDKHEVVEEKEKEEDGDKHEGEEEDEIKEDDKKEIEENHEKQENATVEFGEIVDEVDNTESEQVKQNSESSQESESEVSSREVSLEPKQEPPSRKRSRSPTATAQRKRFQNIAVNLIDSISAHRYSSPFLHPVSRRDAPDYYDVIKEPKDLKNILKAVKSKVEPPEYLSIKQLERDIMLMFANCVMYNKSDEDLVRLTRSMKNEVNNIFKMFEDAESEMK